MIRFLLSFGMSLIRLVLGTSHTDMVRCVAPLVIGMMLSACNTEELAIAAPCRSDVLFGRPGSSTGLTAEQCQPRCSCGGVTWESPDYTEADRDALLAWQLVDPPAELTSDPYETASIPEQNPREVCAVVSDASLPQSYRLRTFASREDAAASGAQVTHFGGCGLCSTLIDLAVYMRELDLTTPVRQCGLNHPAGPKEEHVECLLALGFTRPCAQIWYFNTLHTRMVCLDACLATLGDPYHLPDGGLNECLACDERLSGPVFKALAGRTRRNTGIASALCRPCKEVLAIEHHYH
jgi:hypothetical protein